MSSKDSPIYAIYWVSAQPRGFLRDMSDQPTERWSPMMLFDISPKISRARVETLRIDAIGLEMEPQWEYRHEPYQSGSDPVSQYFPGIEVRVGKETCVLSREHAEGVVKYLNAFLRATKNLSEAIVYNPKFIDAMAPKDADSVLGSNEIEIN